MILSPDVESLFHQAMLQPAHARLRWLETCTEWRGDVVETVRKMIEALPAVSQSNATQPVHGERRGEFTLMGLLGYGSHGSVFLARRDSMPNRVIALKVLPISSSSTLVARFRTEHTALALLDHPGIVGILDVGRFADGEHWIAMPFVPGEPITSFAQRRHSPQKSVSRLCCRYVMRLRLRINVVSFIGISSPSMCSRLANSLRRARLSSTLD